LSALKHVKFLDASKLALDAFETEPFLPQALPVSLEILILCNNQLAELPATYSQLSRLQRLNLHSNRFSRFPTCILQLWYLRFLDLGMDSDSVGARISVLPDEIGNLEKLEEFNMDAHALQAIPMSFQKLLRLRSFSAVANDMKIFPFFLPSNLEELNLRSNRDLHLVPEGFAHRISGFFRNFDKYDRSWVDLRHTKIDLTSLHRLAQSKMWAKFRMHGCRRLPPILCEEVTCRMIACATRLADSSDLSRSSRAIRERPLASHSGKACVVCLCEEATHALVGCGHKCVCETDAHKVVALLGRCPVCQAAVEAFLRVWD